MDITVLILGVRYARAIEQLFFLKSDSFIDL